MNMIKGKGPIIDPGVCRCCGAVKKCRLLNAEYEGLGRKEIYSDIFVDCFGLMLSHLDSEPEDRLICATCVTRLREASCFRQQVLECEEKFLKSKILLHGDNKNDEIKEENIDLVKEEVDDVNEHTDMTDHEDNNDIKPSKNDIYEKPKSPESKKTINLVMKKKRKSQIKITIKSKNMQTKIIKTPDKQEDITTPPDKTENRNQNILTNKILQNKITIVENSYVCPFNSFFNNYYCFYCKQKFFDCNKLREHSLTHDPTTYKRILKNTLRQRFQIDLYRIDCRLCDENVDNIDSFKDHISIVHGKTIYPIDEDFLKFRLTPTNLKCTECNRTFSYFHTLKKHMAEHFGTCICDVCGIHYFEERMLIAHMKSHEESVAKFCCKQCGKRFKSKYNMSIHIARLHTKEAPYLCAKCDEKFFSDTLRRRHMIAVHDEDAVFKCEHCDKVYNTKKTLRDHCRKVHFKIFKHKCNLCEKKFYSPSGLKGHMVSHTGERNFKCEHCGKTYTRLWPLKVHMQSHTSEKKYKCTVCNASYSQNVCLKNHIKRHHQHLETEESFQK